MVCIYKTEELLTARNIRINEKIIRAFNLFQNQYVFQRCINLLNYYPSFGIEQFVPFVKKGVITGVSNTLLLSIFFRVRYCLCDSMLSDRDGNYKVLIESFNLKYENNGFSDDFTSITENNRNKDMIEIILNKID